MKQTLRQVRFSGSAQSRPSPFVCLRCRSRRLPPLQPLVIQRYASDDNKSNLSSVRKKIWGTEHPPGQRDPYEQLTAEQRAEQEQEMEAEREMEAKKQAEAEVVAEAEAEYEPATTWDGLERIGGPTGWWEEAWDREHQFEGFLTQARLSHNEAANTVRRVLIELLALQEAGRPLLDAARAPVGGNVDYAGVGILSTADGQAQLSYKDPAVQVDLLESLKPVAKVDSTALEDDIEPEEPSFANEIESKLEESDAVIGEIRSQVAVPMDQEGQTAQAINGLGLTGEEQEQSAKFQASGAAIEEVQSEIAPSLDEEKSTAQSIGNGVSAGEEQDQSWLAFPLHDLSFRFAFVKRLMNLSGTRIYDPHISKFQKVTDVVSHLSEKPKPKKLAQVLLARPDLMTLPNVEIFERRHTPIDKEKEVGRWKVIEAELVKRGLPVTGHRMS